MERAKTELKDQSGRAGKALIILLGVLVVLILGGTAWAFSTGRLDALLAEQAEPVQMSDKPMFKPLNRFVVSLANEPIQHYMMLELTLVSHHPDMPSQADSLESVIRNALLRYFSGLTHQAVREEMRDIETLQEELRQTLVAAAADYGEELPVEKVLITNVVIQ